MEFWHAVKAGDFYRSLASFSTLRDLEIQRTTLVVSQHLCFFEIFFNYTLLGEKIPPGGFLAMTRYHMHL